MSVSMGARAFALASLGAVVPAGFLCAVPGADAYGQTLAPAPEGDSDLRARSRMTSGVAREDPRLRRFDARLALHGLEIPAAWSDLGIAVGSLAHYVRTHPDDGEARRHLDTLLFVHGRIRDRVGQWVERLAESENPVSAPRGPDDLHAGLAELAHLVARAHARLDPALVAQSTRSSAEALSGAGPADPVSLQGIPLGIGETGAGVLAGSASTSSAGGETFGPATGGPAGMSQSAGGTVAGAGPSGSEPIAVPFGTSGTGPSTGAPAELPDTAKGYLGDVKEAMTSPRPSTGAPAELPDTAKGYLAYMKEALTSPRSAPSDKPGEPDGGATNHFSWRPVLVAFGVLVAGLWILAVRVLLKKFGPRDKTLERRLRRVAAPLAGPAALASTQDPGVESVFRKRESGMRLAWVWRPLQRRYPLVSPPRALAIAVGVGVASASFAAFALWFLKVPAGWWTVPAMWTAGGFGGWQALRWQQAKREAEFIRQFPEIVDQVVRLAGAGVPPVEALAVVTEDATEPVKPVLREVCDTLTAGLDADRALRMTAERVRLAEFTLFAAVLRLQRRAGGGISGAFSNLSETLRERNKSVLKARAATAQTRFTLIILAVMPVVVLMGQQFVSPTSVELLFGTESGTTLLRVGTGLIVTGLLVARAIAARATR